MSSDQVSKQLTSYVEEYRLDVRGLQVWTPYWRDEVPKSASDRPRRGPLNGKGTPSQIKSYIDEHLPADLHIETAQDVRSWMHSVGLGVDCSGLIFHVLDRHLRESYETELAAHLFKAREQLLKDFHNPAYTHPPHITEELLQSQPEWVSLATIREFWGNQPIRLAGVAIMGSLAANDIIERASEAQPGDIVIMDGITGVPHDVVVTHVNGSEVTYAESGRTEEERLSGTGGDGVRFGQISITDPSRPMSDQHWHSQPFLDEHKLLPDGHRRLKLLNRQS